MRRQLVNNVNNELTVNNESKNENLKQKWQWQRNQSGSTTAIARFATNNETSSVFQTSSVSKKKNYLKRKVKKKNYPKWKTAFLVIVLLM